MIYHVYCMQRMHVTKYVQCLPNINKMCGFKELSNICETFVFNVWQRFSIKLLYQVCPTFVAGQTSMHTHNLSHVLPLWLMALL